MSANYTPPLVFYKRASTGTDVIGLPVGDLLVIVHEDTVATYDVVQLDAAEFIQVEPWWQGSELKEKLLSWSNTIKERLAIGLEHQWADRKTKQ